MKMCKALSGMHTIIRRNAYHQALFFFVDGMLSAQPNMSPRDAILVFRDRYGLENDMNSDVTMFNRMKTEYLRENQIFKDGQDNCIASGNGCTGVHRAHMGTARQK